MEHRFLDKSNQRRDALNIHNPVQVERSDTQLGVGKTTAYCLLLLLLYPAVLSAQPGVKITGLAVEAGTVTLNVRWEPLAPPTVWSDTVWVFVDYNDNGTMKRLQLSEGATLTATSAPGVGKVEQLVGNYTGVRVIGNARTNSSFSATVQLLTAAANVAGACAYASNYPPVGEYATASSITFTGTPPFDLTLNPGAISVQQGYVLLEGETLLSFTDKTGAPGIIIPKPISLTANPAVICEGASATLTAVAAGAASYSFDNGDTWQPAATKVVSPTANTNYTLKVLSATSYVSSDSKTTTVTVQTAPTAPTGLTSNVSTICDGVSTSATLTADGGDLGSGGVYVWGTGTVGSGSTQSTSGSTYSVSPSSATTYWVRLVGTTSCTGTTNGQTASIAVHGAISPGSITTASAPTNAGTAPSVTVENAGDASGGSGSLAYEWRRTGKSATTLSNSDAPTYALGSETTNYSTAGIYYFNRYAKDATCTGYAAVAAYGTYTLGVLSTGGPPAGSPASTKCVQCCYADEWKAWVDCYVTTAATSSVLWSGRDYQYYTTAVSDKDGKANTVAVMSGLGSEPIPTAASAFGLCAKLNNSSGWFLPAYEELYNMSTHSAATTDGNKLAGAGILKGDWHWASTEFVGNSGRYSGSNKTLATLVGTNGTLNNVGKTYAGYVRCAWRN